MNTSMGGDYEATALAQMQALQVELDEANKKLDANFYRLENAGLRQVSLSDQYVEVCEQKQEVEQEVANLRARAIKACERLRRTKCPGCKDTFDASDAMMSAVEQESSMLCVSRPSPSTSLCADASCRSANDATPKARSHNANILQSTANTLRRQYEDLRAQWQADCERSSAKIANLQAALRSLSDAKERSEEDLHRQLTATQESVKTREAELKRERTRAERSAQEQHALSKEEKVRLGEEKARLRREIQDLEADLAVAKRSASSTWHGTGRGVHVDR